MSWITAVHVTSVILLSATLSSMIDGTPGLTDDSVVWFLQRR
jgi:hypothetical protein